MATGTLSVATSSNSSYQAGSEGFSGLEEASVTSRSQPLATVRRRGSPEFTASALMSKSCCSRKRVTCFKKITQTSIENIQQEFYSLSETDQTQKVLNYMKYHGRLDGTVLYSVGGEEVCEAAFRMVHGLRYNRFQTIKAKYASGVVIAQHGNLGKGQYSVSSIRAISWLRMFISKVGDCMPMKDEIHLPSCLTKADVYALAADELCQGSLECCGVSSFYNLWKAEFPNVKIPQESRFSKCDVCVAIKEARERTLNPTVREWLATIMAKHIALERQEREKYAKHRNKSQKYPSKYLSLIMDGMDQQKTDLPHIISNPKSMAGCYTLETHVTGVRVHGRSTFMFIDCGQFPHDSNLTIEILLRTCEQLQGRLPPVLYVQLDNTCRENKNKYVLTFMAILVEMGIFRKIKIGFLPVGHTHEDIDQVFSCISRHLKHRNCLTIPDLTTAIQASFTPEPINLTLESVTDAKQWMANVTPSLHDHLKAHQFKFERNEMGHSRMFYKEWSGDSCWLPQSGLALLPEDNSIPEEAPSTLKPYFDPELLQKLETTLLKVAAYLDKSAAGDWWRTWIEKAKEFSEPNVYQDEAGTWALFNLPVLYRSTSAANVDNSIDSTDMSGIEMESPHKEIATAREFPCIIPEVGKVSSSWVGHKGLCDIIELHAQKQNESELDTKSKQLKELAMQCLQAFESAGLGESNDPQVRRAAELCLSYAPRSLAGNHKRAITSHSCNIASLWKNDAVEDKDGDRPNAQSLAESLLGEKLIDKVTEKKHQPPDIYIGPSRTTVHKNQDIVRDLAVGALVAVKGIDFPKVARVTSLPSKPILESEVEIMWFSQERASHKPRWLRYFHPTKTSGRLKISDILLYDFELTCKGAFRKKTRDYLKEFYD